MKVLGEKCWSFVEALLAPIFSALICPMLVHASDASPAKEANDHLVPVVEYLGWAQQYRTLWREKLFVTPGEVARFVHLPAFTDLEIAMSVYKRKGMTGSLAGDYWVTVTEPSAPLSKCIPSVNVEHPVDPKTIQIRRTDAPLPESTALTVKKLWAAMLRQKAPENSGAIAVDSSTELFSGAGASGRVIEAQLHRGGLKRLTRGHLQGHL